MHLPELASRHESGERDALPNTKYNFLREDAPLFYSSSSDDTLADSLGRPHYSYRFAEAKFMAAFRNCGYKPTYLAMPEYYGTEKSLYEGLFRSPNIPSVTPIHFIFKSTEHIRLAKWAYNICCFAWEFEVLKDSTNIDEHPFLNQKRMLGLCNEVWVPCEYTRNVLNRHGLANVYTIPAPIARPLFKRREKTDCIAMVGSIEALPLSYNFLLPPATNKRSSRQGAARLGDVILERWIGERPPTIFLSVLNPEDSRKNIDALIRAFTDFESRHPECLLLVKVLTSATRFTLDDVVADVIPAKLASGSALAPKNVYFFNAFLTDEMMGYLYCLADYYVSVSIGEGQNLPLLEAMSYGVTPITTCHTAMSDYITNDNSCIVEDELVDGDSPHLAAQIAGKPFKIQRASAFQVVEALECAYLWSPSEWKQRSNAARSVVTKLFNSARIVDLAERRFMAIWNGER